MDKKFGTLQHRFAAFIGGFAAAYTLMTRLSLGSSQTVNIMDVLFGLLGKDYRTILLHLFGMMIYGASIFGITLLSKKSRINMPLFCMSLNVAGFALLGLLPKDIDAVVGLYPTFVMMTSVWIVFGDKGEYASSPIFSTNNFRQLCGALADYVCDKKAESLKKARFFAGTLLVFHIGAAAGYFACCQFAVKAAFFGIVPCLLLICVTLAYGHSHRTMLHAA